MEKLRLEMEADLESLFRRYVRTGKPGPLAEIFDRAAPELLRLAVHLCGDMAHAEDLVQSTFLAAIERREHFDGARRLLPWLTGILTKKALAHRRSSGREAGAGLTGEAETATTGSPLEDLARGELRESLLSALDRVPEPYRAPLVLKLRHGLTPTEIAHAIDRSPGTVRVQLHRGLELLRKQLPTGVAGGFASLFTASQGLAAVREHVLAEAARAAVQAGTATTLIGATIVSKKIALAAGLVLAVTLGARWLRPHAPAGEAGAPGAAAPISVAASSVQTTQPADDATRARVPAAASRGADPTPTPEDGARLAGRVIDAVTRAPIENALIELHPAWRGTLVDLCREYSSELSIEYGITGARSELESFLIPIDHSPAAVTGREPISAFVPVRPGAAPMTERRTDLHGRFGLSLPPGGAQLAVSALGYGPRQMPFRELRGAPRPRWNHEDDHYVEWCPGLDEHGEAVLELWPPRELTGRLIDPAGEPVTEEIQIEFWDAHTSPSTGSWIVTSDATGSFRAALPAGRVQARSPSPDYRLTHTGIHPERGEEWVFESSWVPGEQSKPATIVLDREIAAVERVALRIFDADSEVPIEVFRMQVFNADHPAFLSGLFYAPQGIYRFPAAAPFVSARIWADGYVATDVTLADWTTGDEPLPVPLSAGDLPRLDGRIVGGANAAVSLFQRGGRIWQQSSWDPVEAEVTSDGTGHFSVHVPEGKYTVKVATEDGDRWSVCQVPHHGLWVFDLGRQGEVAVTVRDENGAVRANHPVALHAADGRSRNQDTDETGRTLFRGVEPGATRVFIAYDAREGSWVGDDQRDFTLAPAARETVEFTVPVKGAAVFPRIVLSGESADFSLWRARDMVATFGAWVEVGADGVVPVDVQFGSKGLEIAAGDGRRWRRTIPPAEPGYEIHLEGGGLAHAGVCLDRTTGEPLAGVRVFAGVTEGGDGRQSSCVTDAQGRFRVNGLSPQSYTLAFSADAHAYGSWEGKYGNMYFQPSELPSATPSELEVRLPKRVGELWPDLEVRPASGRATAAQGGELKPELLFWITAIYDEEGGSLWIGGANGALDGEGRYRMTVPAASSYHGAMWLPTAGRSAIFKWQAAADGSEMVHDIVVDDRAE